MVRAKKNEQIHGNSDPNGRNDWQDLRSDILGMLGDDTAYGNSDPLQYDDNENTQYIRHRQALESVKQSMQRFSARGNNDVDTAIAQIRGHRDEIQVRPGGRQRRGRGNVEAPSARRAPYNAERYDEHGTAPEMREISHQIAALTDVVEMLANSTGDNSHVNRIEAQVGNIAALVGENRGGGHDGVSDRLERIAGAIDQLSDLQAHYADRPNDQIERLATAHQSSVEAIEAGVRNVYDRIDTLEQSLAITPVEVERLTAEMAKFGDVMKEGNVSSDAMLTRIEALNNRVAQIEAGGDGVDFSNLRADIESLRGAVNEAVEPRFSALKSQIDSLGKQIVNSGSSDNSIAQLDAQIRQLIAKMEQTGEQLADIKDIHAQQTGAHQAPAHMPDIEKLADAIAKKAAETGNSGGASTGLSAANIDELEARLGRLFHTQREAQIGAQTPSGADVERSNKFADTSLHPDSEEGSDRLGHLEKTLARAAEESEASTSQPNPATVSAKSVSNTPRRRLGDRLVDAMANNPAEDLPLVDHGYEAPTHSPHEQDVETASTRSKLGNPDIVEPSVAEQETPEPVAFDPATVDRPSKPRSSLFEEDAARQSDFTAQETNVKTDPRAGVTNSSRNTFIEAARRAAQKQEDVPQAGSQSLMARALQRIQNPQAPAVDPSHAEPVVETAGLTRAEKKAAAKAEKAARARLKAEAKRSAQGQASDDLTADIRAEAENTDNESFLSRNRRVILLSVALVTICLLSFNLIERRLNGSATTAPPSVSEQPAGETDQLPLDSQPTGSIDPLERVIPNAGPRLGPVQALPSALSGAAIPAATREDTMATGSIPSTTMPTPPVDAAIMSSPIRLELPPEQIGPMELREAAANGDPRAQFEVAAIYSEGQAVGENATEAAKWYERSAAQGFAPAEYRLANHYEHGKGVARDLNQAKLWYQRAAEAGNRMAMHNLAALYASGELGKQEFSLAAEWFERAASRGLTDSQFNLGMLYARGLGVPQNMTASYKWFSLAAERGDEGAFKARDDIARSLDAETVSRLKLEIANWKSAEIDIRSNFAPIGTWSDTFNPGQEIRERNVVEKVQGALNRLGYNVGVPDGLMGPRTKEAITSFERESGMSESGAINPRLLAVLGSQPV